MKKGRQLIEHPWYAHQSCKRTGWEIVIILVQLLSQHMSCLTGAAALRCITGFMSRDFMLSHRDYKFIINCQIHVKNNGEYTLLSSLFLGLISVLDICGKWWAFGKYKAKTTSLCPCHFQRGRQEIGNLFFSFLFYVSLSDPYKYPQV